MLHTAIILLAIAAIAAVFRGRALGVANVTFVVAFALGVLSLLLFLHRRS